MSLITLRSFEHFMDAHIAKAKLESEGIRCFLFDEYMMTLNPLYNLTVGGVKLKVNSNDIELATGILDTSSKAPVVDENGTVVNCTKCNSTNFYTGFKSFKSFSGLLGLVPVLLFSIYPFYFEIVKKCKECRNEF